MDTKVEVLNNRINLMQIERNPFDHGSGSADHAEISMLQFAAGLKSLKPGATTPDAEFVRQLRQLVLAKAVGRAE